MAEDSENDGDSTAEDEEKSFRERVEEIRERRAAEGGEGDADHERMEEMMGGPGGMGGNPFAQMMGGMMGGGPGMGGPQGAQELGGDELVREVRQLRDEVRDINRTLERIANAVEED